MNKIVRLLSVISMLIVLSMSLYAQAIPPDSLYLAQIPPTGITPTRFFLPVSPLSFTAERIAITNDGREIYYTVVRKYYPITGDTIKYFKYTDNKWTGPFNLFNGYLAPGLSLTGDTIYFQNNNVPYQTLYSVRAGTDWSIPQRILYNLNSAHYLQVTNNGSHYISSISDPGIGASDWCKLLINGTDTSAISFGLPLNTNGDNLDFYVARDESFMIITRPNGLHISYHKNDNSWTNPKNLGSTINFGNGMWGTYVSSDNKYLFYTTGTNYSDTYIYWSRIDGLIDSLRNTNFIPYLKNQIPGQSGLTGQLFTYTVPDTTIIDDDGNNTLTYSATLSNGNPLPAWLSFDPATLTFTGTPTEAIDINVKVKATDTANESASCTFPINIIVTGLENNDEQIPGEINLYQNYPNPFNPTTTIGFAIPKTGKYTLGFYNALGELVKEISDKEYEPGYHIETFDAARLSSGIYIYRLTGNNSNLVRKMVILR